MENLATFLESDSALGLMEATDEKQFVEQTVQRGRNAGFEFTAQDVTDALALTNTEQDTDNIPVIMMSGCGCGNCTCSY